MTNFKDIWDGFSLEQREHFTSKVMPNSRYRRYMGRYLSEEIPDLETFINLSKWVRENIIIKVSDDFIDENSESNDNLADSSIEETLLHTKSYYYDETRDIYVVHVPSKKKPLAMNGEYWRSIRSSYSNWGDSPSSVNQICRKFSLSRRTAVEILKVMGVTHDSSPWTDEIIDGSTEEALVKDLLRQKEESVLVKAQRKQWKKISRDADRYRNLMHFLGVIKASLQEIDGKKSTFPKLSLSLKKSKNPYSVVLSPTDFHWGKYATQVTKDPYNREIAKKRLLTATEDTLGRISNRGKPEYIFLAIGGDGLHIDNQHRTTTRGTPQDCDGTPSELASSYVRLCIEYIELVKQFTNVRVFIVPGNHDYYTSAILREAIRAWYRNDKEVMVFDDLSPRQTFLYGNSLISFIHGDDGKVKDYPTIVASESSVLWGKSHWRFIFTGHLHTERELPQYGDTTVYRMPSLAGTDEWHFRKGYRSRKALIGYIIDKEKGVIATEISPVYNAENT